VKKIDNQSIGKIWTKKFEAYFLGRPVYAAA